MSWVKSNKLVTWVSDSENQCWKKLRCFCIWSRNFTRTHSWRENWVHPLKSSHKHVLRSSLKRLSLHCFGISSLCTSLQLEKIMTLGVLYSGVVEWCFHYYCHHHQHHHDHHHRRRLQCLSWRWDHWSIMKILLCTHIQLDVNLQPILDCFEHPRGDVFLITDLWIFIHYKQRQLKYNKNVWKYSIMAKNEHQRPGTLDALDYGWCLVRYTKLPIVHSTSASNAS